MLNNFQTFIYVIVFVSFLYNCIHPSWVRTRRSLWIISSHVYILYVSLPSFYYLVLTETLLTIYLFSVLSFPNRTKQLWYLLLFLLVSTLLYIRVKLEGTGSIPIIAVSFIFIRAFSIGVDIKVKKTKGELLSGTYSTIYMVCSFLPTFGYGPIERLNSFSDSNIAKPFKLENFSNGLIQVAVGVTLMLLVGEKFVAPVASILESQLSATSTASFGVFVANASNITKLLIIPTTKENAKVQRNPNYFHKHN